MKQKIRFSPGLYLEGLRQLRLTGIIGVIIMAGITAIMLISLGEYDNPTQYTGISYLPWLLLSFVGFMPLLMLQMFSFMNKRNASDMYHSIPHTRSTMYLSFSAAVITWVLIILFAAVLTGLIGAWLMPDKIALAYKTLLLWILYCISASLLVGGAILIAKGLTGTLLNSIVLTALVLFFPRFLMSLFIGTLESNPIFDGCLSNSFTASSINPVVGIVFELMGIQYGMGVSALAIHIPSIVYGFVLGLIYFAVGGFLFCRRNSETASQSAPSRFMQAVYRVLVAMTMCSAMIVVLFQDIVIYTSDYTDWTMIIIAYVVIIFVYFLYELLTTRKVKNLVKAIPTLGIVAVLNVAIYFGLAGAYNSAMNFRPAPDEINSVTVLSDSTVGNYGYMNYTDYVLTKAGGIKLTDQEILNDVSYCLELSLDKTEVDVGNLYNDYDNMTPVLLEIETDGGTYKRNVYMTMDRYQKLSRAVSESKDFQEAWTGLPDAEIIYIHDNYNAFDTDEEVHELYDMFREETKNADLTDWISLNSGSETCDFTFTTECIIQGVSTTLDIYVNEKIAPKTVAYYYEKVDQTQYDRLNELKDTLKQFQEDGITIGGSVYMYVTDDAYGSLSANFNWDLFDEYDLVLDALESRADGNLKDSDTWLSMNIDIWYTNEEVDSFEPIYYSFLFPADDTTIEILEELNEEYLSVHEGEAAMAIYS